MKYKYDKLSNNKQDKSSLVVLSLPWHEDCSAEGTSPLCEVRWPDSDLELFEAFWH